MWVSAGGFVVGDERAREARVRETDEEVGIDVDPVAFLGLYDAPDSVERVNVSAAYLCRPTEPGQAPEPGEEARAVEMFDPRDLPPLGFDHDRILDDAMTL